MRVTILGATGRVGRWAVDAAVAAGHDVVVLSRSPSGPSDRRITVVQGSVGDEEAVRRAVARAEAVVAALGPRQNRLQDELALESGMRILTRVMADAGVNRLVALSGAAISVPGDRKPAIDRLVSRVVGIAARHVVGAKQREYQVFSATDLAWTAVRPAIVTDGEARGYRLALDLEPGARTTRADVGQALVDQLSEETYIRRAPFVLPP